MELKTKQVSYLRALTFNFLQERHGLFLLIILQSTEDLAGLCGHPQCSTGYAVPLRGVDTTTQLGYNATQNRLVLILPSLTALDSSNATQVLPLGS